MISPRRVLPPVFASAFVVIALILASPTPAHASTPTTTTLTVTSSCLTQGCAVTLTAKVAAGAVSVHPGLVYFCEATAAVCENGNPVGTAQITSAGTATIAHTFAAGAHNIYAVFHGTNTYSASTSASHIVTIAPSGINLTSTTFTPQLAPAGSGDYILHATVVTPGKVAPTGTVSFVDTTDGNSNVVATSGLQASSSGSFVYNFNQLNLSNIPYSVFGDVTYVATGDVNNDGYNDVVFVGKSGLLNVLASHQFGNFTNPTSSAQTSVPSAPFILVDVNGDGNLDAVFPDTANNAIRVAFGNGDGTFASTLVSTSFSNSPAVLYAGDFNNDGIPDLAILLLVPNTQTPQYPFNAIQIALGKGDGTFNVQSATYLSQKVSGSILIGDEDKDGKLDLIVNDSGTSGPQFQVLHGNGDGTFTPITATTPNFGVEYMVTGDFNADGIPDIVTFDGSLVSFWQGVGDGTFTQPDSGNGDLFFGATPFTSFMVGDFNNDGVLDVAGVSDDLTQTTTQSYFVPLLGNNSDPSAFVFQTATGAGDPATPVPDMSNGNQTFGVIAAADFNGDGIPDFIDFNPNPPTGVSRTTNYIGQFTSSSTTSSTAVTTLSPPGPHSVVAKYSGDPTDSSSTSNPVTLAGSVVVDNSAGFAGSTNLALNGGASIQGGNIQLTSGTGFEARSAFNAVRLPVYDFHTSFDFQIPSANSDGLAFVIQSNGPNAVGGNGGGIGYGLTPGATSGPSIINSLALIFDTHNNQGEGANSIRIETGGITSPNGSIDLTPSGIDLHSGHKFQVDIVHSETEHSLTVTVTDLTANKIFSHTFTVDLFGAIGDTFGYVGFTSATGATSSTVNILNWIYTGQRCCDTIPNYSTPYFPTGFTNVGNSINTYGGSAINGSVLQLTNNTQFEATNTSFFPGTESSQWATDFDFTIEGTGGDGFTFMKWTGGYGVVGATGGALGYAGPYKFGYQPGVASGFGDSLAVKFDVHNNAGEGTDSTGLYFNGAYPSTPAIDLAPSRVNLSSGHIFHARISYFHGAVNLSITDLNNYAVFSTVFPQSSGLPVSAVGFTAATGNTTNTIKILNWTYDEADVDQ